MRGWVGECDLALLEDGFLGGSRRALLERVAEFVPEIVDFREWAVHVLASVLKVEARSEAAHAEALGDPEELDGVVVLVEAARGCCDEKARQYPVGATGRGLSQHLPEVDGKFARFFLFDQHVFGDLHAEAEETTVAPGLKQKLLAENLELLCFF